MRNYLPSVGATQSHNRYASQPSGIVFNNSIHKMRRANCEVKNLTPVDLRLSEDVLDRRLDSQSHVYCCCCFAGSEDTTRIAMECPDVKNGSVGIRSTD